MVTSEDVDAGAVDAGAVDAGLAWLHAIELASTSEAIRIGSHAFKEYPGFTQHSMVSQQTEQ
jgi:hypothetical protein